MADLRPSNVLISASGAVMLHVRIADTLRASQFVLPPERVEQDILPPRGRPLAGLEEPKQSAVFCLGCVMWCILDSSGHGPFEAESGELASRQRGSRGTGLD